MANIALGWRYNIWCRTHHTGREERTRIDTPAAAVSVGLSTAVTTGCLPVDSNFYVFMYHVLLH